MEVMTVKGKTLELGENGFLTDPAEWNIDVANYIAAVEGIRMTEHHWEVVNFLRDYYRQYKTAPMIKVLAKELGRKLGPEKGNARFLY